MRKRIIRYCEYCGSELKGRQYKYCSNKCQSDHRYKIQIDEWKQEKQDGLCGEYGISKHIRRYMFEKCNNTCMHCGWGEMNYYTGNIPLEVHHIDGDYRNNKEVNLELLCPNCHSLTATYKAANSNGRKQRVKYA